MRVLAYGRIADVLGSEREIDLDRPCTVAELQARLVSECPQAAEALAAKRVLICIGDRIVREGHVVRPDDIVEFLAPVSGG